MSLEQDSIVFLIKVYNEVGSDTGKPVKMVDIAEKIGIEDADYIQTIWGNLEQEKCLKVVKQFSVPRSDTITTHGIKKAEAYLVANNSVSKKPKKPIGFIHD